MAAIAGLSDSRQQGPPGDIGTFQKAATVLVFKWTFSGATYTVAMASGVSGWVLIDVGPDLTGADIVFNNISTYLDGIGGGHLYIQVGIYYFDAIWYTPTEPTLIEGAGWATILYWTDGSVDGTPGHATCITIMSEETILKEFKVDGNRANNPGDFYCIFSVLAAIFCHFIRLYVVNAPGDAIGAHEGDVVMGCRLVNFFEDGIEIGETGATILIHNNYINGRYPVSIYSGAGVTKSNVIISENEIIGDGTPGIRLQGETTGIVEKITIIGNHIHGATGAQGHGIRIGFLNVGTKRQITITDNKIYDNEDYGIRVEDDALYNSIIADNWIYSNGLDGLRIEGNENYIVNNVCDDNGGYGLYIEAGIANIALDNNLRGNASGPFFDGGTGTILAAKIFQFVQGTTFISADGSAKGWEINAEADWAVTLPQLPPEVQQVVRLKIWAVALDAPPGSPGYMHLDLLFNAGGSLEEYNEAVNSWTLANFNGEEADYVNGNVIHWVVEDGDVGDKISVLLGGDSLELKVNGGTAAAPDGATNAVIKALEISYV